MCIGNISKSILDRRGIVVQAHQNLPVQHILIGFEECILFDTHHPQIVDKDASAFQQSTDKIIDSELLAVRSSGALRSTVEYGASVVRGPCEMTTLDLLGGAPMAPEQLFPGRFVAIPC
ncbi:hypothetical protein VL15_28915 [Burkholderia cepacia]|uniref:Uncharacterized protein n=1 Tax=Burkholderia cepacia TaxID=292 RepID=A0A0J5WJL8_BURCE|nr:hypothetical protein VL15_28915 [Burkholderia cepacia]